MMTTNDAGSRRKASTWAVLAPVDPAALEGLIAGEVDEGGFLRVERGTQQYHAVVSDEPGSEGADEDLAVKLSRAHPGRHYALVLDPEYPRVELFEGGRFVREQDDDPGELARGLGCPVVPAPQPRTSDAAVVVAGVAPERVRAALGLRKDLEAEVSLRSGPVGTIATSTRVQLVGYSNRLSEELQATVYVVVRFREDGYFRCWVLENGEDTGLLDWPATSWSRERHVSEVLGQSTPEGILGALGVEL